MERSENLGTIKAKMDYATILGILCGFGLTYAAIITGSAISVFFDLAALLIVLGGTSAIIIASFSFKEVWRTIRQCGQTMMRPKSDFYLTCYQLIQLAQLARSKGVLTLQAYAKSYPPVSLMSTGITMLTDGMSGAEIQSILLKKAESLQIERLRCILILRKAAEASPAMGLIGTLVGLVQMLGQLDDPSSIGPAMAVALLTTFYGAVLANLLFTPLANKLEQVTELDIIINQIYVTAICSMARAENPRRLEILMNTVLPPTEKIKFFE